MSKEFWDQRYLDCKTGWDVGGVSGPMEDIISQLNDTKIRILIPGCGSGYEAMYLLSKGFESVYICDISTVAIDLFVKNNPDFPLENILAEDFFKIDGEFDLILEQTFFCAISPTLRDDYVKKTYELLARDGELRGVMFDKEFESGPPYGGSSSEYKKRFEKYFRSVDFIPCLSSITPRLGSEVLIKARKD